MPLTQVSPGLLDSNAQYYGFKNRIINGAMVIAQRGTAAVTTNDSFAVDRFFNFNTTDGAFSAQQDASAPAGFLNSVKWTTTTADGTLTTTQNAQFTQRIEGTNVADLGWGTASASTVTLSFWVRSSLTGTFGGALKNSDSTRSYPFTYTISVTNTWEYKTVTISGDTSGTWLTTNGIGIQVIFGMGAGPDRVGTAGAWASANYVQPTSTVSVIGTLNATWQVTGVQLEKGSTATSFDYRPYGTELSLCQRYFQTINAFSGTANATTNLHIKGQYWMPMRGTPSISQDTVFSVDDTQTAFTQSAVSTGVLSGMDRNYYKVSSGNFTGLTIRQAYWESGGSLLFSAEL